MKSVSHLTLPTVHDLTLFLDHRFSLLVFLPPTSTPPSATKQPWMLSPVLDPSLAPLSTAQLREPAGPPLPRTSSPDMTFSYPAPASPLRMASPRTPFFPAGTHGVKARAAAPGSKTGPALASPDPSALTTPSGGAPPRPLRSPGKCRP